jgi:hypothetical protein
MIFEFPRRDCKREGIVPPVAPENGVNFVLGVPIVNQLE